MRLELSEAELRAIAEQVAAINSEQQTEPEPWIDTAAAAEYLCCKVRRIYDLVHQRRIPHVKDGSRTLLRRSALDDWLASGGAA